MPKNEFLCDCHPIDQALVAKTTSNVPRRASDGFDYNRAVLLMAVAVWLTVRTPAMHEVFGFAEVNYGFASVLLGGLMGLIQPLTGMAMNAYSRFAEYRADAQAVKEGYGEALVGGLKKLARENYANLAPSKALVVLEYSHPPLSERIGAIQKK